MSTTKFQKWVNQMIRRVQRWYEIDPEFRSYMPDDHREYRFPAPGLVFFQVFNVFLILFTLLELLLKMQ